MTPQQAAALTDDEANAELAKLTGWTQSAKGWWSHPTLPDNGGAMYGPPDFCNDLNVVHEVEKAIPKHLRGRYCNLIAIKAGDKELGEYDHVFHPIHATARQRCEALLVTMGGKE